MRPRPALLRCAIFALCLLRGGQARAQVAPGDPVEEATEYRTPRAGEAFKATVFGHEVDVPARDRSRITALDVGVLWIPDGPEQRRLGPFGSVYLWRNWNDGQTRLRAIMVGVYDSIRWDTKPSRGPVGNLEAIVTFENLTPPFDRSDYVEGARIRSEELESHEIHLGAGLGYRVPISPGHQDNTLEIALSYEPGVLFFRRGEKTDPDFIVPKDTYEGRVHFRFRADTIERNPLELPHTGFAAGLDAYQARRSTWEDWGGGPVFGLQSGRRGRGWRSASCFAMAATPVPFVRSERHRLITSVYGGRAVHVDRFSAFRLGGGPTSADSEALSRPVLPATAFEEVFTKYYGILNVEYRYEVLFFLYLQLRGSLAQIDRARFDDNGGVVHRVQPMNSLTASVNSGFLWNSSIELGYSYNFGILRQRHGESRSGDGAILILWAKNFKGHQEAGKSRSGGAP